MFLCLFDVGAAAITSLLLLLPASLVYHVWWLFLWSLSLAVASVVFVRSLVSLVLGFFYDAVFASGVAAVGAADGVATDAANGIAPGVTDGVAADAADGIAAGAAAGVAAGVLYGVATGVTNGVPDGVADGVPHGVVAGVAAGVTDGVAAAALLVFFGLLSLVYARSLVYLWWLPTLCSIRGCGKW